MLRRFVPLAVFVLLFSLAAHAQTARPAPKPDKSLDSIRKDDKEESSLPGEMLKKMEIARAENEHKKLLADVEKLSDLSNEIARVYGERKQLSSDDAKKLGTIEKLAKRVLENSGGDQVDNKSGPGEPITLEEAIDKLNVATAGIKKDMNAETRFVVSASVIAKSNEVIHLARFIRHARKPD